MPLAAHGLGAQSDPRHLQTALDFYGSLPGARGLHPVPGVGPALGLGCCSLLTEGQSWL